jgi:flagellar protein FlbB
VAGYGGIGAGLRIMLLVLVVVVLVLGGLVWFDYLGLLDARSMIAPVYSLLGGRRAPLDVEDPLLLERERLNKQLEALALRAEELEAAEMEIRGRQEKTAQILEQLEEREKALDEREKVFNERIKAFENRRVNLERNSEYLVGMPPENAVSILLEMEDQDIIDVFRTTEEQARVSGEISLVAYWLSLMPPERAAVIQRKMSRSSGG